MQNDYCMIGLVQKKIFRKCFTHKFTKWLNQTDRGLPGHYNTKCMYQWHIKVRHNKYSWHTKVRHNNNSCQCSLHATRCSHIFLIWWFWSPKIIKSPSRNSGTCLCMWKSGTESRKITWGTTIQWRVLCKTHQSPKCNSRQPSAKRQDSQKEHKLLAYYSLSLTQETRKVRAWAFLVSMRSLNNTMKLSTSKRGFSDTTSCKVQEVRRWDTGLSNGTKPQGIWPSTTCQEAPLRSER